MHKHAFFFVKKERFLWQSNVSMLHFRCLHLWQTWNENPLTWSDTLSYGFSNQPKSLHVVNFEWGSIIWNYKGYIYDIQLKYFTLIERHPACSKVGQWLRERHLSAANNWSMNVSQLISLVLQRARRIREDQTTKCRNGEVLISQAGERRVAAGWR